ncbi:meteorin-like protein [Platysternon megacephalum]|uniref:Meteorin-like protein n=1 Tax=Platysternon megacephalum TaxID=55544 RepID=A0A4D9E781_9SAUR|nr:meteorin-like protein [Platysternon megacephalum]
MGQPGTLTGVWALPVEAHLPALAGLPFAVGLHQLWEAPLPLGSWAGSVPGAESPATGNVSPPVSSGGVSPGHRGRMPASQWQVQQHGRRAGGTYGRAGSQVWLMVRGHQRDEPHVTPGKREQELNYTQKPAGSQSVAQLHSAASCSVG